MSELTRAPLNALIWAGLGCLWWPFFLMLIPLFFRTLTLLASHR